MENKLYIGIDNGVTGTLGFIVNNHSYFIKLPVRKEQNYTKKKGNVSRVAVVKLRDFILSIMSEHKPESMFCLVERPMVNSMRFNASLSAVRALEAVLNMLEMLEVPYRYIDSKEWQKYLLPIGIKGTDELKKASRDIGIRTFPQHKALIEKHKDADGMLIAEYCREKY